MIYYFQWVKCKILNIKTLISIKILVIGTSYSQNQNQNLVIHYKTLAKYWVLITKHFKIHKPIINNM